jgi:hypothetical protein
MFGATLRRTVTPQVGQRLWLLSALVLAVMPALFVFAHRSSPLILSIAAALALLASAAEDRIMGVWTDVKAAWRTPVGLAATAFLAFAALSISWSEARSTSLFVFGELLLPIGAALILAVALPGRVPRQAVGILACAIAFGCVVVHFELATDSGLAPGAGARAGMPNLQPAGSDVSAPLGPTLWFLVRAGRTGGGAAGDPCHRHAFAGEKRGRGARADRRPRGALDRPPPAATARRCGRRRPAPCRAACAPLTGELLERTFPTRLHDAMETASSRIRVDIYRTFGAAVALHPIGGAGFGASTRYQETSHVARLAPERRALAGIGHPHNAALQIWVELGLVGAMLAAAVVVCALRGLLDLPTAKLAPRLALFAGAASAAMVGHGAWQGWWAAALGAGLVWLRCAEALLAQNEASCSKDCK